MCGIAGIYGIENREQPVAAVRRMTTAISHRGPDSEGVYEGKNVVLGHRRLSIIDLSEASNQPFLSGNGRYALVYNGELYNYLEIKGELPNYDFKTQSDTEVVMAALSTWGIKALQKFNGMFAFAFWDNELEKLWIARDRVGIKPLYYAEADNTIVFASEVRSMLASGLIQKKLNGEALVDYLRYQTVHAPQTLIAGVQTLEAGTYMEISDSEIKKTAYWKPWMGKHDDHDRSQVHRGIRDRLTTSIERRLVADVPFGAFLSGGIDSSLIVGIITEHLNRPIDTFNISFDEAEFSEATFANEIANRFKTNHHEIKLQPSSFLEALPSALQAMDHPSGDGPNTWIVSRETKKQGISMALSGLGGDELFAGYDVFTRIPYVAERHWILSFPKGVRAMVGELLKRLKPGFPSAKTKELLLADYFDLKHLYPVFRKVLLDPEVGKLLNRKGLPENRVFELVGDLESFPDFTQLPTLSRIGISEMSTYMQSVLLRDTDQMSMSHALEVRVPFLDQELIEYVTHVGDQLKFPHQPKQLLTESFKNLLPDSIVNRQKMGFVLPWEMWLKGELRQFSEEHINWLGSTPYFDDRSLAELWSKFLAGNPFVTWSRVWPLITLAHWMKTNEIE